MKVRVLLVSGKECKIELLETSMISLKMQRQKVTKREQRNNSRHTQMIDQYSHIPLEELTHEQLVEIVKNLRAVAPQNDKTNTLSSDHQSEIKDNKGKQQQQQNNKNKSQQQQQQQKAIKTRREKKESKNKQFDWSKVQTRHIALKIAYIGFNYQGFASQVHTTNTVEHEIFTALKKTRIIESETTCNYSRCGRTDKGVSALCQVIGIKARSSLKGKHHSGGNDQLNFSMQNQVDPSMATEIDYVKTLNNVLPDDIRVLGWAPVGSEFDARFGCIYRTYKYFFVRGDLDVEAMAKAAEYFVGYHDFRNFCKINAESVKNFHRKVLNVSIRRSDLFLQSSPTDEAHAVYEIVVCGYSFLWHQIRCMASILFHVGRGEEKPEIIKEMLNADKYPRKPQYTIASEFPLCLWDCVFEDVKWIHAQRLDGPHELAQHFLNLWKDNVIKNAIVNTMLSSVYSALCVNQPQLFKLDNDKYSKAPYVPLEQIEFHSTMQFKERGPKYVPLLERPTGTSFEEKLEVISNRKQQKNGSNQDDEE